MTFRFARSVVVAACMAGSAFLAACAGASAGAADAELRGVYTNAEGNASVEFTSGGKAHFSLHGVGGQCTFTQQARTVLLTCEGDTTGFTIDDGALTGPPDSFLTRLKKKS